MNRPTGFGSLAVTILLAGCSFSPSISGGTVECGPDGECPPGQYCASDNYCYPEGGGPDTDGGGTPDGGNDGGGCSDRDGDGVCDVDDNCPDDYNPGQGDCDDNGAGDACEPIFRPDCMTLSGTFSAGGGLSQGDAYDSVGTLAEPAHSVSAVNDYRLRGGLLPTSTGVEP